jgi:hypothetical protein
MDKSLAKLTEAWSANPKLERCLVRIEELQAQPAAEPAAAEPAAAEPANAEPANAESVVSSRTKGWGVDALLEEFPELSRGLPETLEIYATLRYHRLRICEALGKTQEVAREAAWLHAFSKKELDELF